MEAGRVIGGKYRLRREIGKGAMGAVWAAKHENLGRSVAVKFLRPTGLNPETAAARFVAEARMAAAVKHRFVVDIFDFGLTEDGISYMVLELLEGEELGERMYYGPPVQVADAVRFVGQCLGGLSAVHEAGIVHRDLKPENIFMMQDADGIFPKLLDFGISKRSEGGDEMASVSLRPSRMGGGRPVQLTQPGTVIGTPWYMAPEQLRGKRDLDARTDVYAIGIILWEWLTGRVPFDDDNIGDLVVNMMSSGPPDLMAVRPELGPELADVLRRAMALRREERFQSAQEMRDALQALPKLPEAWTVVQKAIANLSSREVLGVAFPSESPSGVSKPTTPLRPAQGRPLSGTGQDATLILAEPTDEPPTVSIPAPVITGAPVGDESLSWRRPAWLGTVLAHPQAQRALSLYQRFPGYVVAGAISLFLFISLAIFSGGKKESEEHKAEAAENLLAEGSFVTSAAAQDASARRQVDDALAQARVERQGEPASVVEDAGVGASLDAGAEPKAEPSAVRRPQKGRPARKPKTKPKRLIRSLDF